MKTITYTVYTFDELSEEAKQKAIQEWRQSDPGHTLPFLSDNMNEWAREILLENEITLDKTDDSNKKKWCNFSEKYFCYYSLSYCQGDGAMIEFVGTWKNKYYISTTHSGHYYHSRSRNIDIEAIDGSQVTNDVIDDFSELYDAMCKELAKRGYNEIDYNNSDEYISETLSANDYHFTQDGKIHN